MAEETAGNKAASLLKSTGIFAAGTFGSKVLVLLIIPLCTHFIDTKSMGIYDVAYTMVQLLTPIAMLSVAESLFRWMLDATLNHKQVFSTWITLFVAALGIFTLIFWIAYAIFLFEDATLIYFMVISACAYQSAQFGTRGLHNNKLFAVSGIIYSILYCSVTAILVVCFRVGYQGLLIAILAATSLTTILLVFLQPELRHVSHEQFNQGLAKLMIRYSIFLLPNSLSWWALNWLGRLFIVGILGYAANGVYSVAMKFPSALSMIATIFGPAWQEQAVVLFGQNGSDSYFSKVFERYSRFFLSLLLPGIPVTVLFIRLFMEASYVGAANIVTILYLGSAYAAFSTFFGVMYMCAKDTRGAASTTIIGACITALLSLLLIPMFGIFGAACSSALGNFSMWILRTHQTRRYSAIEVPWIQVVGLTFIACGVGFASSSLVNMWQLWVVTGCGLVAMLLVNHDSIGTLLKIAHSKMSHIQRSN